MESNNIVASLLFYFAFAIDIGIMIYAYKLAKRMSFSGALYKVVLFVGLSALIFGIHHLGEIWLEGVAYGMEISEAVEGVAAILLLMAAYNLFRVARGI